MVNGYAHEFDTLHTSQEEMDLVVYTPDGKEVFKEYRKIDGYAHAVFQCSDGMYRAQLPHAIGMEAPEAWEVVHEF